MVFRQLSAAEGYKGWFVDWIEEWSQFLGGCNWYTFHPVLIEIEDDRIMGGIEATVIVLGLGARVRWNHTKTLQVASIERQVAELTEKT